MSLPATADPAAFADLLLRESPARARSEVLRLLDEGLPPRGLYVGVLAPALEEVGARWQRGTATVAQEHLATAVVSALMAAVAPRLEEPPPVSRAAVLACTDGELHSVGLRMVADFLEADGWDVRYLGAATPSDDLIGLAEQVRPDVVGLSTSLTTHLDAAASAITRLRAVRPEPFVLVGGRAYVLDPGAAGRVGADATVSNAAEASRLLRERFAPI